MDDKKICFVIFPFKHKELVENIYKPALEEAGLIVEIAGSAGVDKITDDIEAKIRKSLICFADVTEDNPNVWYEVGFAYACGKQVVTVCNKDERELSDLPFDIKHRNVIDYSQGGINEDENTRIGFISRITRDAKAKTEKAEKKAPLKDTSVSGVQLSSSQKSDNDIVYENLTGGCIKILKNILNNYLRNKEGVLDSSLKMVKSPVRIQASINRLRNEGYIEECRISVFSGAMATKLGYQPTTKAIKFAGNNQHFFDE